MSLISIGARSHLDRLAWGNPSSQLAELNADELRALLQMAQAEGQPEVERWVRDAMSSRGIYASHVASFRVQSKMSPQDWLAKAMALILAGGVLMTPALPVVDQYSSGGGSRSTPVETVAPVQDYTAVQTQLIQDAEGLFASHGLRLPNIEYKFLGDDACGGYVALHSWEGNRSVIKVCIHADIPTLVHEMAHAWDRHNLTDADRDALLEKWGLKTWDSYGVGHIWGQQGAERAAKAIAYELTGDMAANPHQSFLFPDLMDAAR